MQPFSALLRFSYPVVRPRYIAMLLLILLGYCSVSQATTCQYVHGSTGPQVTSFSLTPANITAGADLPNGTVLYRGDIGWQAAADTIWIGCDAPTTILQNLYVDSAPHGLSAWGGSPFGGTTYETGIPGIGIAIWFSDPTKGATTSTPDLQATVSITPPTIKGFPTPLKFSLIKTGNIQPGTLNGADLPSVIMKAESNGVSGLPLTLLRGNFSGIINIVSQTCQTPDVTVPMGTYEITKYFRGVGSSTPWVDASIQLVNCPRFYGYHSDSSLVNYDPMSGMGTFTSTTPNLLKVSLQPATNIADQANGVLEVNANGSSGSPATGVGIQLGYTPDNINASPTAPTTIWKSGDIWSVTPPNNGTANFRIPLAARYYQYDKAVTPGPANAQITFVIDYN
ncbi:fimbrial protein [Citrobacter amalonaticus]|uniref:fimbrial protein n=1 Tax=Citrobacter amalonaticus TaxID=35703 RepID=UPI00300C08AC